MFKELLLLLGILVEIMIPVTEVIVNIASVVTVDQMIRDPDSGYGLGWFTEKTAKKLEPWAKLDPNPREDCPDGWVPFNKDCYYFVKTDNGLTADEAKLRCDEEKGALISIHGKHENEFIADNMSTSIPLNGLAIGNTTWIWGDGTALDYTNWGAHQPGEGGCLMMVTGGEWRVAECGQIVRQFVCRIRTSIQVSAGECDGDSDCSAKPCSICVDHHCADPECCSNDDCPTGYCYEDGRCEGECDDDADCQFLNFMECSVCENFICSEPECCTDDDCEPGFTCQDNSCVKEGECSAERPCEGAHEICVIDNNNNNYSNCEWCNLDQEVCNPGCAEDSNCPASEPICSGHRCTERLYGGMVKITIATATCSSCAGSENPEGGVQVMLRGRYGLTCTSNGLDNKELVDYDNGKTAFFDGKPDNDDDDDGLGACKNADLNLGLTSGSVTWTGPGSWTAENGEPICINFYETDNPLPTCCCDLKKKTLATDETSEFENCQCRFICSDDCEPGFICQGNSCVQECSAERPCEGAHEICVIDNNNNYSNCEWCDLDQEVCKPGCAEDSNCPASEPMCSTHRCLESFGVVKITIATATCSSCAGSENPLGTVEGGVRVMLLGEYGASCESNGLDNLERVDYDNGKISFFDGAPANDGDDDGLGGCNNYDMNFGLTGGTATWTGKGTWTGSASETICIDFYGDNRPTCCCNLMQSTLAQDESSELTGCVCVM